MNIYGITQDGIEALRQANYFVAGYELRGDETYQYTGYTLAAGAFPVHSIDGKLVNGEFNNAGTVVVCHNDGLWWVEDAATHKARIEALLEGRIGAVVGA